MSGFGRATRWRPMYFPIRRSLPSLDQTTPFGLREQGWKIFMPSWAQLSWCFVEEAQATYTPHDGLIGGRGRFAEPPGERLRLRQLLVRRVRLLRVSVRRREPWRRQRLARAAHLARRDGQAARAARVGGGLRRARRRHGDVLLHLLRLLQLLQQHQLHLLVPQLFPQLPQGPLSFLNFSGRQFLQRYPTWITHNRPKYSE